MIPEARIAYLLRLSSGRVWTSLHTEEGGSLDDAPRLKLSPEAADLYLNFLRAQGFYVAQQNQHLNSHSLFLYHASAPEWGGSRH